MSIALDPLAEFTYLLQKTAIELNESEADLELVELVCNAESFQSAFKFVEFVIKSEGI